MNPTLPIRFIVRRIGEACFSDHLLARQPLDSPALAEQFFHKFVGEAEDFDPMREHLVAITLDTKLRPTGFHLIALGSLNECVAHPREILRPCIVSAAYAFVLAHNHPSGDPSPSAADRRLTTTMREASSLMQINLIDHIIIGTPDPARLSFFSFRDAGLL